MVFGVISLMLGGFLFLTGLFGEATFVLQQTVQYLIYVCSTLFVCTGFICITMEQTSRKAHKDNTVVNEIPSNTIQKTETAHEKPQDNQSPKKPFKNVSELFDDDEIMRKANELRRMYGKEMYVDYLNDKARELGLAGISLTIDDVE